MTLDKSPATHPQDTTTDRIFQRVRYPLAIRAVEGTRVVDIAPRMRRVIFKGPDLEGFIRCGFDDHVKLILPSNNAAPLVLPIADPNGVVIPDGERAVMRDYTPRHFDPIASELAIDFVLHEESAATNWAANAAAGQQVSIGGPRGSILIPTDFATHVLIGDESALPANGATIGRASSPAISLRPCRDAG